MRQLHTRAELLAAAGEDPWLPLVTPEQPVEGETAWVVGRSLLLPSPHGHMFVLPCLGTPAEAVRDALAATRDEGLAARFGIDEINVPRAGAHLFDQYLASSDQGEWDWMYTRTAPPRQPLEDCIVTLDDGADAEEINALAHANNHRVWVTAGEGRVEHWVGIREGDELIAAGGAEFSPAGKPQLVGIVSATAHRGRGLGAAVTSHLTRWALDGWGTCMLGLYADNDTARRLYRRLGYVTGHQWQWRTLA